MSQFENNRETPDAEVSARALCDDAVLSLRPTMERLYSEAKRAQQDNRHLQDGAFRRISDLLHVLIRVADGYEDAFRTLDKVGKRKKDSDVETAFRVGYIALIDALEAHHVYQVPVLGLRYDEVQFNGIRIEQPWEVAGKTGEGDRDGDSRRVKDVLRPLWVQVGDHPRILRRAQVLY